MQNQQTSTKLNFPPGSRLRTRREILSVQNGGKKLHTKNFILILRKNSSSSPRLGVTVSKKVDKRAVARNKIKRRVRELFRTHAPFFRNPVDLLVIARHSAVECDFKEMRRQIIGALQHHKIVDIPRPSSDRNSKVGGIKSEATRQKQEAKGEEN